MELDLTPTELLTTTRAVRRRLDLARPVEQQVVEECLRIAFQAPNGSNQQLWDWVLVDDPTTRAAMADIYRGAMDSYIASGGTGRAPRPRARPSAQAFDAMSASVFHLYEHLHEVPVLVVPTIRGRMERVTDVFGQASLWGSILPGIWSFMLALRSRGLGSSWTTIHLHAEEEMAGLLGIPHDEVTQAGLFPVGYTLGTDFQAADRSASEDAIHWNRWGHRGGHP